MNFKIWLLFFISFPLLLIHQVAHAETPSSLISYWNFDESNTGTATALDQIDGNDGFFGGLATRTNGLLGVGAASFTDTNGDRVSTGAGTGSNYSVTTGITVEALILPNWSGAAASYAHLFRKDDGGNRILFSFQNDSNNGSAVPPVASGVVLSFGLNVDGVYSELDMPLDGADGRPTLADLKDGNTHYAVATYDSASGDKSIYIDGTLRFSTNLGVGNLIASGGGALALIGSGWSAGVPNSPFNGVLDEVAFYNAALPENVISTHYSNIMSGVNYFTSPLPATPVPTMSVWGLGILAGLLGLMGFVRRRKA